MPYARDDELEIFYDATGPEDGQPLVLIAGTGAQLVFWHPEFVALLVAEGFRVVRIDNRDVGLSTKFGGPRDLDGGYQISDFGDDIVRVLDAEGIARAHLVGHSMGGMVAQVVAIDHPERVASLGLLASIPGQDPRYILHGPLPEKPPGRLPRWAAVRLAERVARPREPQRYDWERAWVREAAGIAYDRCWAPAGLWRQFAALKRAPDRLEALRGVRVPTLVLRGDDDRNLHWCAAVDIADAIPDAELVIVPGLTHALPRELWPTFVSAITRTARRATRPDTAVRDR